MGSAAARAGDALPLRVGGVVPFTSTDYPDMLAAVIFCQGCPWHCGYCHNAHLIPARGKDERHYARILAWLETRVGLLDAVVFSGGEPTAQAALGAAMDDMRELGFAIGLHTSGAYPRRLAQVLPNVDWVGVDFKAPVADYASVTGAPGSGLAALESLDLIRNSGVAYEVRTTVHPSLTPSAALVRLARELAACGVRRWTLQAFRPTGCANDEIVAAAPSNTTFDAALLAELAIHMPVIEVRA
jgi:pyruvate formate lyase activating enzyme